MRETSERDDRSISRILFADAAARAKPLQTSTARAEGMTDDADAEHTEERMRLIPYFIANARNARQHRDETRAFGSNTDSKENLVSTFNSPLLRRGVHALEFITTKTSSQ